MDTNIHRRDVSDKNGKSNGGPNGNTKWETKNGPNGSSTHAEESKESGGFAGLLQRSLMPVFLMFFTPNLVLLMWYTVGRCDGSFLVLVEHLTRDGLFKGLSSIWLNINIASPLAVGVLVSFIAWSLLLMVLVPGPRAEGPLTPKGHVPVYRDNGFSCYIITMTAFTVLAWYLKTFTPYSVTIVYDRFDEFIGTLTVFSHVLCFVLNVKGLTFPSTPDSGSSGNLIFDYYWGTELYPNIFGIDIKVFTNCRFGMTVWPLLVMIFTIKNYELYGFVDGAWVSCILQMVYFTKFFWWESGYMRTIDIMVDRAGFYICWGCLCYVPGIYASVSMYLAEQAKPLGTTTSLLILVSGLACCVINYAADLQKLDVRNTDGKCKVWGQSPEIIRAQYQLETGETKTSLLLVSGYWGIARHFHYIPELALAFLWTLPALFTHLTPYVYFINLLCILIHRTFRDDIKCGKKYGRAWSNYCDRVPYKMIPYVF